MDERIQVYETKMGKTLANLESELARSVRAVPIPTCWIVSWWIITVPPPLFSRWPM